MNFFSFLLFEFSEEGRQKLHSYLVSPISVVTVLQCTRLQCGRLAACRTSSPHCSSSMNQREPRRIPLVFLPRLHRPSSPPPTSISFTNHKIVPDVSDGRIRIRHLPRLGPFGLPGWTTSLQSGPTPRRRLEEELQSGS